MKKYLVNIVISFVQYFLLYLETYLIPPLIVLYVFWFVIPLIPAQELMGGTLKPLLSPFTPLFSDFNVVITNKSVIPVWETVSTVIFFIRVVIEIITGRNIYLGKKTFRIMSFIPVVSFLLFVTLYLLSRSGPDISIYGMFFTFLLVTQVILGLYFGLGYVRRRAIVILSSLADQISLPRHPGS